MQQQRVTVETARNLISSLGGSRAVARQAGITAGGVRMWAARGSVPYRRLHALRKAMRKAGVSYAGPTTRGLDALR